MIRIGLFQDCYYPLVDGVCEVVDHYARGLQGRAEVTVFVPRIPGRPFDDSVFPYRVVRCNSVPVPVVDYALPVPDLTPGYLKLVEETKLDLVHVHSPFTIGRLGIRYGTTHQVPVVATLHSQFHRDFKRAVGSEALGLSMARSLLSCFRQCDECWAVNGAMEDLLHEQYGVLGPSRVMRNATDMVTAEHPGMLRRGINKKFGLSTKEVVFLFVGRLNNLKNVFLIADSLAYVKARTDKPFRMLFIGTGQDEKRLKERVKMLGIEDRVIFAGKITNRGILAAAYQRADLFLFPSLYDASSLVQVEAASQCTPALFVRGAVTAQTVTPEVNGFVAEENPKDYGEKILSLMKDPKRVREVGKNAHRDLYLRWDDVIDEVYENYERLIRTKPGGYS